MQRKTRSYISVIHFHPILYESSTQPCWFCQISADRVIPFGCAQTHVDNKRSFMSTLVTMFPLDVQLQRWWTMIALIIGNARQDISA